MKSISNSLRGWGVITNLLLISGIVNALTDKDVASVFPGTQDLTTLNAANRSVGYTLTIITNSSHALVVLNDTKTAIDKVGWYGHGLGTGMSNGDLYAIWPNSDDTWTISHRQPANHVLPNSIASSSSPNSPLLQIPSLTTTRASNTSWTSFSFLRPLDFSTDNGYTTTSTHKTLADAPSQRVLWTIGNANPGTKDPTTGNVQMHTKQGAFTLDLSQKYSLLDAPPPQGSGSESGSSGDDDDDDDDDEARENRLILAHAILGGLSFMVFSPLAILIARFFRSKKWYPIHSSIQLLTTACIITTWALGVAEGDGHEVTADTHKRLGLAIFILIIFQSTLGVYSHYTPNPPNRRRPPQRWAHIVIGISLTILGYIQIHEGFREWDENLIRGHKVPMGVKDLYWVLLAIDISLYFLGIQRDWRSFLGNRRDAVGDEKGLEMGKAEDGLRV